MNKGGGLGITVTNIQQTLFVLRAADMAVTTDQAFTKLFNGTKYIITGVFGVRKTGALSVACLGGIYDAAAKGGNALVAAAQSWAALTGVNTCVVGTLAAVATTTVSSASPILSLSTGNSIAMTADIFLFGVCVD